MMAFLSQSIAQDPVFFIDNSSLIDHNISSDISLAVCDVNGDFRDDLIRSNGDSLTVHVQVNNGTSFKRGGSVKKPFTIVTTNIGDFNQNHKNEILISGFKEGFRLLELSDDLDSLYELQNSLGDYYAQGSSLSDINNDGWLDAFITNDIGYNVILNNDQNGELTINPIDDFNVTEQDSASGNYNAVWFDFDNDLDLDLFISKCLVNATSFTDKRRINQFFVNEGGQFIESASLYNLDHGDQTWCADTGDFDNDGDMDLVIINHGSPSLLLENDGGKGFIEHESFSSDGIIQNDDLQVVVADFNNDGLEDIIIVGIKSQILLNKGSLKFEAYDNAFGFDEMTSCAFGDLNQDGWLDLLGVYGIADSPINDRLLLNLGGVKNYIQFTLTGNISSINAVGTKVELYGEWGLQQRWVKSGVAYGITNTMNLHFGLDNSSIVDSVKLFWPSGLEEVYYNIAGNTHYVIEEGKVLTKLLDVNADNYQFDCEISEITMASSSGNEIVWNNAFVGSSIEVTDDGLFYSLSQDSIYNPGNTVCLTTLQRPNVENLLFNGEIDLCNGDQLLLSTADYNKVIWSNGVVDDTNIIEESGSYHGYLFNKCDTVYSDTVSIYFYESEMPQHDTINETGEYELNVTGSLISWYDNIFNQLGEGTELTVNILHDSVFYFKDIKDRSVLTLPKIGDLESQTRHYSTDFINSGIEIEVFKDVLFKSCVVETDLDGERKFLIINEKEDTIFSDLKNIEKGISTLEFNTLLIPGKYKITTDISQNIISFGHSGPRLSSVSQNQIPLPFQNNGYIEVRNSISFLPEWAHFFDLAFDLAFDQCESDFIEYKITLDTTVSVWNHKPLKDDLFYPNPTNGRLYIKSNSGIERIVIYDMLGREVGRYLLESVHGHTIDLSSKNLKGSYIFKCKIADINLITRVIIE
ncbi:MAG: VCBS repeat-containing protein [Bacteroidia bacterium]|nr:VCBS repeat-containing protein [Bacteroidia bacterium]